MKKFLVLIALMITIFTISCNGQPKGEYQVYTTAVAGASQYHYFLEKDLGQTPHLIQGADYLSPSALTYQVAVSTATSVDLILPNDGAKYIIGVVAVDAQGFYSGMGVASGTVNKVPVTPAGIGLRKKP